MKITRWPSHVTTPRRSPARNPYTTSEDAAQCAALQTEEVEPWLLGDTELLDGSPGRPGRVTDMQRGFSHFVLPSLYNATTATRSTEEFTGA